MLSDVAKALGIKNPSITARALDAKDCSKKNLGQRGLGAVLTVSERGLYETVSRAHKSNPKAREFKDWVFGTVLPSIRKDGGKT